MSSFENKADCKRSSDGTETTSQVLSTKSTHNGPDKIILLLDRSGSMTVNGLCQALLQGVNSLISEQKEVAQDSGTNPDIEVYVFNQSIDLIRTGKIMDITEISEDEVMPRGGTALNDSIAHVLDSNKDNSNVLYFIFTDGKENSSGKHRGDDGRQYCKSLITLYSRENNWTVIFGAANIDAYHTGAQYGITSDNAFNVSPDASTVTKMMREFSGAVHTSSTNGRPIDITSVRQASEQTHVKDTTPGSMTPPPLARCNAHVCTMPETDAPSETSPPLDSKVSVRIDGE